MKTLKIVLTSVFILLTLTMHVACSDGENVRIEQDEFTIKNLNLDLSLDLKSEYNVSFKSSNTNLFLETFSKDLFTENSFTFIKKGEYSIVNISNSEDENNQNSSISYKGGKTCKTCKSEACVKNEIKKAIGNGKKTVYIKVSPVKKFGLRVGVEVCKSDKPITETTLNKALEDIDYLTKIDIKDLEKNKSVVNIDEFLANQSANSKND